MPRVLVDPAVAVEMRRLRGAELLEVRPRRQSAAPGAGGGPPVAGACGSASGDTGRIVLHLVVVEALNMPHIATSMTRHDHGEHDHEPDDRAHIDVALLVNDIRVVGGPVRMVRRHLSAPHGAVARASA